MKVIRKNPAHHVLVDFQTEGVRNLLRDAGTAKAGFRRFISRTAAISSFDGPLGPGRRPVFAENSH